MKTSRRLSFLEVGYIECMAAGGDHGVYVVANNLDHNEELCNQLRETYQEYKRAKGEKNAN